MTFKDIKPNYEGYLFHKGDTISVERGKVVTVSNPRFQTPATAVTNPFAQTNPQVVDVTIDVGGKQTTYTIPDNLDITYAGTDLAITTNKDSLLREVESIRNAAEDSLRRVDRNKTIVTACDAIIAEWNPVYKEKKQTEERFGKIESQISDIGQMVKELISKLS